MKTALSSFDLQALVAEWQELIGGHVDKAYQKGDEVILRVNAPARGKVELFYQAGRWLCLHEVENKPESPPPFAQSLRRLLDNARIQGIEQHGFDRIAVFHLERGGEPIDLVFEVFGKGNIVVAKKDTIAAVLFPQTFKDRAVQIAEPYRFPQAGLDPLELDRGAFANALRTAKGQVVRVLASVLNLGGTYAEEVCLRADVEKQTKVKELSDAQVDGLYTALNNLAVAVDQERRPVVVFQDGRAIDATPIELAQYRGLERRDFPAFNQALSHYLTVAEPETAAVGDAAAKFERRIVQQRESMEALREEAMRLEAQAVFLYGHYGVFDAITLDYEKDVTANAQALYDRRKDGLAKAQRVDEATAATRAEMEVAQARAIKVAKQPRIKSTKSMWFEAYRWTLSSERFLILGGRDARTNDQLVKKHLKEGDRYAHADVHGAPSTVVKDGARASDATLREACEFALSYSKAWSAGLASGSAYWVLPEQVSKQAESGEFLPRGAFVIRGKRNYFHDLPVRMAIGEVEVEGHRKIMGGPVTAVAARSARHVVLAPGKGDREAITKKLASIFEVPIEEIARAMPPGSVEIIERHGIEA